MKTAIILHGRPSKTEYYDPKQDSPSNAHWLPWLQQELLMKNVLAQTPELPRAYKPNYQEWEKTFNQFTIDNETILIGHSTGAGFLIRWLSENKTKVNKVILVAPYLDPKGTIGNAFFRFKIDKYLASQTKGVVVFNSDDDGEEIQTSVKIILKEAKDIQYKEFHNYGHFCYNDMKTREFPELLEEVLK